MQCTHSDCKGNAVFHLSWIETRRCAREQHLCEDHARAMLTDVPRPSWEFSGRRSELQGARQFEFHLIVISEINDQQVVYLREVDGPRWFPMLIGIFEATSLDRTMKRLDSPRPLAYDAMAAAIRLLGGTVHDVVVHFSPQQKWYCSYMHIKKEENLLPLDTRPSDAFVLAVLFDSPIYVGNQVLEQLDQQTSW